MWEDPAGDEPIGTCRICGGEIRVDLNEERLGAVGAIRAARAAAERHLQSHTPGERARAELRSVLDRLSPRQRSVLVKDIYTDLIKEWGDQDSRGVYSIDEVLGSTGMHRLWQQVSTCGCPGCREQDRCTR